MPFGWFNAHQAIEVGTNLADHYAPPRGQGPGVDHDGALRNLLRRAGRELQALQLNVFQKAKFANSFKWRLIENGVEPPLADEVTNRLVLHLSARPADRPAVEEEPTAAGAPAGTGTVRTLVRHGDVYMARGAYAEALLCYESMVELNPRHPEALNSLGAALCKLGRYKDAEEYFRRAIKVKPDHADAYANLGSLLRWRGHGSSSESALRRALKLRPGEVEARSSLGLTLLHLGRTDEAKQQFHKALKIAPRNPNALIGMGQIARTEGRFEDARALFQRVLDVEPGQPSALASLASLGRMTGADRAWLQRTEALAAGSLSSLEECDLRFALGKYYDDVGEYERAFRNFQRANELAKTTADEYDRVAHTQFVDDLRRHYTREALSRPQSGASASDRPVFILGMMRSGTSLAEQIIASHPAVHGAGELPFWTDAMRRHDAAVRRGLPPTPVRAELASEYLRTLESRSGGARYVVDKAPVNAQYLGVIHSVFPHARIIHMRRDPIDTCLSCYFQQFSTSLNFTMDLSDLAHYHREHLRLMAHWRAVLPSAVMLDVPYSKLVSDPETWTRRILKFLGLEWDQRCLDFHLTQRTVSTASAWQVRQKIYRDSLQRWRHYGKFIGPLRGLKDPGS